MSTSDFGELKSLLGTPVDAADYHPPESLHNDPIVKALLEYDDEPTNPWGKGSGAW